MRRVSSAVPRRPPRRAAPRLRREAAWRRTTWGRPPRAVPLRDAVGRSAGPREGPSLLPAASTGDRPPLRARHPAAKQAARRPEGRAGRPAAQLHPGLIARSEGRAEDAVPYVRKVLAADPKDLGRRDPRPGVPPDEAVRGGGGRVPVALAGAYNVSAAYTSACLTRRQARGGPGGDGLVPEAPGQRLQERARLELPRAGQVRGGPRSTGASRRPWTRTPRGVVRREGRSARRGLHPRPRGPRPTGSRRVGREGRSARPAGRGERLRGRHGEGRPRGVRAPPQWRATTTTTASRPAGVGPAASRFATTRAACASCRRRRRCRSGPPAAAAAFVDIDHDGDLDVFVAATATDGRVSSCRTTATARSRTSPPPPSWRWRRGGRRGAHRLRQPARRGPLRPEARPPALFKNMRDGSFKDLAAELGLVAPGRSLRGGGRRQQGRLHDFSSAEGVLARPERRPGAFGVAAARVRPRGLAASWSTPTTTAPRPPVVTAKGPRLLRTWDVVVDVSARPSRRLEGKPPRGRPAVADSTPTATPTRSWRPP